ncbi:MAG: repeat-containing protein [Chlamydiales bacterium]|jgi:predicted O-linked N-acetylglucosamine transferase (SPINDLY family)|nr:repeat-containing protein [Chlamydiales bacterium]
MSEQKLILEKAITAHQIGDLVTAENLYLNLLKLEPQSAKVIDLLAHIYYQQNRIPEAILKKGSPLEPQQAKLLFSYGALLHKSGQRSSAKRFYQKVIELEPQNPFYRYQLAFLLKSEGLLEQAKELLKLPPFPNQHLESYILLGNIYREQKEYHSALEYYQQALKLREDHSTIHFNLGLTLEEMTFLERAITHYRLALETDPKDYECAMRLGICLTQSKLYQEAYEIFKSLIQTIPTKANCYYYLGNCCYLQKKWGEAKTYYETAIELGMQTTDCYNNLGLSCTQLQLYPQALKVYEAALNLDPQSSRLYNNLGNFYLDQHLIHNAMQNYRKAIELDSHCADAYHNIGSILADEKDFKAAVACFEKSLELDPVKIISYLELGLALQSLNRIELGLACYSKALEINPKNFTTYYYLGLFYKHLGQLRDMTVVFLKAIKLGLDHIHNYSHILFNLAYDEEISAEILFELHKKWGELFRIQHPLRPIEYTNDKNPNRKIKLAYISPDLNSKHPIGSFLLPIIPHHDRSKFEVYCYFNHPNEKDPVTQQFRETSNWRNIYSLTDKEVTELIQKDEIDILITLCGHTAHNRLKVLGHKPAPIQVNMGYHHAIGLDTIDYRITDNYCDPIGKTICLLEEPIRLNSGFCCYQPAIELPPIQPAPYKKNNYITFGHFNTIHKISPLIASVWAKILICIPNSHLLLKLPKLHADVFIKKYSEFFLASGISTDRINFVHHVKDKDSSFNCYNQADIALDPYPYNGCTTSCESLWMGLPLITLAGMGGIQIQRVGVSLLSQLNLTEFIANTPEEYVRITVRLSQNLEYLDFLRDNIRTRILSCSLGDSKIFTPQLEAAYKKMWEEWCTTP